AALTTRFGPELELLFEYRRQATKADTPRLYHKMSQKGNWRESQLNLRNPEGEWHEVALQIAFDPAKGELRTRFTDGKSKGTTEDTGDLPRSPTELGFVVPAGSNLWLRNVRLKPLALKPIFNG